MHTSKEEIQSNQLAKSSKMLVPSCKDKEMVKERKEQNRFAQTRHKEDNCQQTRTSMGTKCTKNLKLTKQNHPVRKLTFEENATLNVCVQIQIKLFF